MIARRGIAWGLAGVLTLGSLPPPSNAQPALAAPVCLIPGVGWTGCAVIGTVMVAGTAWYLIRLNSGHQTQIPQGNLRIDDPDQPIEVQMLDYVWGDSPTEADHNCRNLARTNGLKYKTVRKTSQKGKRYECWVWLNHPEATNVPQRRRY